MQVNVGQADVDLDLTILSVEDRQEPDMLRKLPTEIRLMIFRLLLVIPRRIFCGAREFSSLCFSECDNFHLPIPWQILATCWQYFSEAMPIMYGENDIAFFTGRKSKAGKFIRFPVAIRYMPFLRHLSIYFSVDSPKSDAARRLGHFLTAIQRQLHTLAIVAASERFFEERSLWYVVYCDHPLAKAISKLVSSTTVAHLKIRTHNGAMFYPSWVRYIETTFKQNRDPAKSLIEFSCSCSCNQWVIRPQNWRICYHCGWPKEWLYCKEMEIPVMAADLECSQTRLMEMEDRLFELGILPGNETDEEVDRSGPYATGRPVEDTYDDDLPAFHSGALLPEQRRKYRGESATPATWRFKQTKLHDFFTVLPYDGYFNIDQ
ncbi:hypothetical protein BS50DRAFT_506264 [Corynespora cassiicola Philippines]|uniref:F-box domain-containing protein n=1 Tax=Corynespora cassiicola Philippines TaxID=1448308 RepID=A0A2T2N593_CORCC|nr:hypothetical protein BS50DRAFT_506264 [Corynespora cassiicola Philippines]